MYLTISLFWDLPFVKGEFGRMHGNSVMKTKFPIKMGNALYKDRGIPLFLHFVHELFSQLTANASLLIIRISGHNSQFTTFQFQTEIIHRGINQMNIAN